MKTLLAALVLIIAVTPAVAEAGKSKSSNEKKVSKPSAHEHSPDANKVCPLKDKKIRETRRVSLKGSLVCMSCDLKKEKECRKVFVSAEDEATIYTLCPETDLEGLEKASVNGPLTVSGTLTSAEDENDILLIDTWDGEPQPGA